MRVAVIDVGSNTARLLVADVGAEIETVREEKAFLGLAADIVRHGEIRRGKLGVTGDVVARYARIARQHDAEALEILVTAPGRQGRSSKELVTRLERAARAPVRVLSANEEGSLAFDGAVLRTSLAGVVAVCDVGGGSTELAIGTRALGATWVRSADIGSLRLTRALLPGDPPSASPDRRRPRGGARGARRPVAAPRLGSSRRRRQRTRCGEARRAHDGARGPGARRRLRAAAIRRQARPPLRARPATGGDPARRGAHPRRALEPARHPAPPRPWRVARGSGPLAGRPRGGGCSGLASSDAASSTGRSRS